MANEGTIAVVAGSGQLPLAILKTLHAQGRRAIAIGIRGEADERIAEHSAACYWMRLGQFGPLIKAIHKEQVKQLCFAGGIVRKRLFMKVRPDIHGFLFLLRLSVKRGDDVLLRILAKDVESHGSAVVGAQSFLPDWVPTEGKLSAREFTQYESNDQQVGLEAAKLIGSLDIGQTVVVRKGVVIAVEAIEGTDATLIRAGELVGKRGGVVVKLCKPHQDTRFDLPSVGVSTIETMKKAGLTALVVEAGKSLLLDPVTTLQAADAAGIAVVAVKVS